eukprot:TRINITY_DN11447_c0_g1_i1.p1 TRINITY_DN11447_c0_g1~~TRINITY_DN11447_c0_g1_i1.p1  ORF type:complete len:189 (+),score=19.46 TRINITY_DN11447_c0_g1_i1:29-595(+)
MNGGPDEGQNEELCVLLPPSYDEGPWRAAVAPSPASSALPLSPKWVRQLRSPTSSPQDIPRARNVQFRQTPSIREVSSLWSRQLMLGVTQKEPAAIPHPFVRDKSVNTSCGPAKRKRKQPGSFSALPPSSIHGTTTTTGPSSSLPNPELDAALALMMYGTEPNQPLSTALDALDFSSTPREQVCCALM